MIFAIIGIILGIVLGFKLPYMYNPSYALYVSVGILACSDAIVGGVRALLEEKFETEVFISGFVVNALLAAVLAYVGERLGVPLYYAAIVTFGGRLFENFSIIRKNLIIKNKNRKTEKK